MTMQASGTDGFTFPDNTTQKTAFAPGMRNKIINGAMMIDQRNAGASVTPTANTYTLDRWGYVCGGVASKFSIQQNAGSITPPSGFVKYLGLTSQSAYSISSTDRFFIQQGIEGFNVADLAWGTANAKTITLSAWVYSSLTGTFGGAIQNNAGNRSYPFTYSIPVANTWTSISITVPGDTTGTWLTDSNGGVWLVFGLGVGSTYSGTAGSWAGTTYISATGATSVVGTNGATFYITGVQLEKGATATPFENRLYGTELALCQRYYETNYPAGTAVGSSVSSANVYAQTIATINGTLTGSVMLKVPKRASPTIYQWTYSGLANQWHYGRQGATETAYTPANFSINQNSFAWWNSGIPTNQDVHYGMYAATAEL